MNNQEFFALLEQNKTQEQFELFLTGGRRVNCKPLTALHLKDLVESVVDSPLTQSLFSTTINKIFKQSILDSEVAFSSLNYADKIMFAVATRIVSLSPEYKFTEDDVQHTSDLSDVRIKLLGLFGESSSLFQEQSLNTGNYVVTYGIPLLVAEDQLNNDIYKNSPNSEIQTQEQLRKVLGEAFINEIAKTIRTVEISGNKLDLSLSDFKTRLKVVESLPASLLSNIIRYIEQYKKQIELALTINFDQNKTHTITIDGSLFTSY